MYPDSLIGRNLDPNKNKIVVLNYYEATEEETAIWFGILTLIGVEVGLITPPVGLNVFIINKIAKDVPISDTFRGVLPFLLSDFLRVVLLFLFPSITLVLVRALY